MRACRKQGRAVVPVPDNKTVFQRMIVGTTAGREIRARALKSLLETMTVGPTLGPACNTVRRKFFARGGGVAMSVRRLAGVLS